MRINLFSIKWLTSLIAACILLSTALAGCNSGVINVSGRAATQTATIPPKVDYWPGFGQSSPGPYTACNLPLASLLPGRYAS